MASKSPHPSHPSPTPMPSSPTLVLRSSNGSNHPAASSDSNRPDLWEVHVREPSGAATHRGEKVVDSTGRVEVNNRSERASTGNKRKGDDSDDSETKRPRTTRRRILILVELGEQTLPFCGPVLQT
eukprot:768486-Hanusia_phi.AAC.9